jgi:hypothetical protein
MFSYLEVNSTFSYLAYGLGIRATMPLPELVEGEAKPDVNIRFGCLYPSPFETIEKDWGHFSLAPREDYLFWREIGLFSVRGGNEIIVDPAPGLDESMLRLFVLGPVLAVLLHQQGRVLLHASAVAVDGEAVLFLGDAGWGKSTMAATLHARGHGLATDDVAVLQADKGCPVLFPGFPQLKLWPEALVSLGDDPQNLPRCNPHLEKRARSATHKFPHVSLPVKRIYVLDEGKTQEILPLPPQEALVELLRHTYGGLGVGSTSHFYKCIGIVGTATVCKLRRQKSLSQLPNLAQLIEEDLCRDS